MRSPVPFGKYLLLDRISVGGMAEVYKAKSYGVEGFEKVIAIKRILPSMGEDREFVRMFIDEAKIAGQLSHANICQIFELGRITGQHFIAMEYIWGKDLLQIHNRFRKLGERMPVAMACYIISRVCEGLHYAHKKKDALGRPLEIVHRDCSPQNMLISYEGEVKLIDFGIAKAASRSSRTNAGVLKGKFGYMSPEQVRGMPLDRRSDIFAIGTVLHETLTGQRLFLGESDFSTLERVRNADIANPRSLCPDIPEAVDQIVMKALRREPGDRYQWCGDMNADLRRYLGEQTSAFTNKNLSDWIKKTFAAELERERELMEEYKRVDRDGTIGGQPIENQPENEQLAVSHSDANNDITTIRPMTEPDPVEEDMKRLPAQPSAPDDAPTAVFGEISLDHLEQIKRQMQEPPAAQDLSAGWVAPPQATTGTRQLTNPGMQPGTNPGRERTLTGSRQMAAPAPATMPGSISATLPATAPPEDTGRALFGPSVTTGGRNSRSGKHEIAFAATEITPLPETTGPETVITKNPLDGEAGAPVATASPRETVRQWGEPHYLAPPGAQHAPSFGNGAPSPWPEPAPQSGPMTYPYAPRAHTQPPPMRGSRFKDIALGISIAAVVVVLIAIGQRVINGEPKPPPAPAYVPPETGTLAVVIDSHERVKVEVNGELVGEVQKGDHLTLERQPGEYKVTARAQSGPPCERMVKVAAQKVEVVRCEFKSVNKDEASLVLRDLKDEHRVFVDDVEVATAAARNKVLLSPSEPHVVEVRLGDEVVNRIELTVEAGRSVTENAVKGTAPVPVPVPTPAPAPVKVPAPAPVEKPVPPKPVAEKPLGDKPKGKPGFLVLYSQPAGARVIVDGKDTGRSTPIPPSKPIELSPGTHKVTFDSAGTRFNYSVTIQSGKARNMNVTLTR